jgi:hypothetical protein
MAGFCWLPYHHVLHRHTASNGANSPDKERYATSLATVVALRVCRCHSSPLGTREIDVLKCSQDDEATLAFILPHCVKI